MKIAAIVPVYNREQYIGAYLEQLLQNNITPFVVLSDTPWGYGKDRGGNEETLEKDKTEEILDTQFPNVKVIKGTFLSHGDQFLAADEFVQEYDRVIVNDCDMFMDKAGYIEFIKFISQDFDVFRITHDAVIIEYFHDCCNGAIATPGGANPILAYRPGGGRRANSMTGMEGEVCSTETWLDTPHRIHHMRYCKPNGSGAHQCKRTSVDDRIVAPQEIRDLLKKWQKLTLDVESSH